MPKPSTKAHPSKGAEPTKRPVLPDLLTQFEVADVLGVTTRQIRNLEERGLPVDESTGHKRYPKRECQAWYIEFKQEEALARIQVATVGDLEEAQRRKMLAEAKLAELKLLREEGAVVPNEAVVGAVGEIADRLRAAIINIPSTFGLHLEREGVTPKRSQVLLEEISDALIVALRGSADAGEEEDDGGDLGDG